MEESTNEDPKTPGNVFTLVIDEEEIAMSKWIGSKGVT